MTRYIHGIHDEGGEHLHGDKPGWTLITESVGLNPNAPGRDYRHIANRGISVIVRLNQLTKPTVEQMREMWYNTGVNHIKSSQVLLALGYPFSTCVRGTDTMSNHTTRQSPEVKTCTKCGESKPLAAFYRRKSGERSGQYYAYCKACSVLVTRESQRKRPDHHQVHRERERLRREKARLDGIERVRDPEKNREISRRARARNPLREKAHVVVRRAVERGDLPPAWSMVCDVCQEAQAENWHHHLGYAEEHHLDVLAVCDPCHGKEHRA